MLSTGIWHISPSNTLPCCPHSVSMLQHAACVCGSPLCSQTDVLARFSNWGTSWVHLAAPGVAIQSTVLRSDYAAYSGTSMATPVVSGAAALALAAAKGGPGSITPVQLKDLILRAVDQLPSLSTHVSTSVSAGLAALRDPAVRTVAPAHAVEALAISLHVLHSLQHTGHACRACRAISFSHFMPLLPPTPGKLFLMEGASPSVTCLPNTPAFR
jgi:hypothetical protein